MIINLGQISLLSPLANILVAWTIPLAMLLGFLWIPLSSKSDALIFPQAKITIKVIDEKGSIVEDAMVRIGFYEGAFPKGLTDSKGLFVGKGRSKHGHANISVEKNGYYRYN